MTEYWFQKEFSDILEDIIGKNDLKPNSIKELEVFFMDKMKNPAAGWIYFSKCISQRDDKNQTMSIIDDKEKFTKLFTKYISRLCKQYNINDFIILENFIHPMYIHLFCIYYINKTIDPKYAEIIFDDIIHKNANKQVLL